MKPPRPTLQTAARMAMCAICAVCTNCAAPPLPVLYIVPNFQLTAQTGQPFDSRSLRGHVWVADFIYTTCPGPCPLMSKQMGEIERSTAALSGVDFVSFTVDPDHDTPEVLAAYAKHFLADPNRWFFLTGTRAALEAAGRDGFKLNAVDGSMEHSTRFTLVDRRMRIRGYYSSTEDGFMPKLLRDIHQLEQEP